MVWEFHTNYCVLNNNLNVKLLVIHKQIRLFCRLMFCKLRIDYQAVSV